MNRIVKRLAVPLSAAAVLGTAGFAYMANNPVETSYAGAGSGVVDGYAVYDISFTPVANNIGWVHFDAIPADGNKGASTWEAYASVTFPNGHEYTCTEDTRNYSNFNDSYNATTQTVNYNPASPSPQATWTCDVRGAGSNGESATASSIVFTVMH